MTVHRVSFNSLRNMRSALVGIFLAVCVSVGAASAQSSNNYGSPYSRFGLGERVDLMSSMSDAMGGAGVAMRSSLYNNVSNPAQWADLSFVGFSASAQFRGTETTDAGNESSRSSAGGVGTIELGIPLSSQRVGLTLAFRPYSRVDYRAIEDGEIIPDVGDIPVAFRHNFEGNGGIHQLTAGLGARLSTGLSVGASAEVLFGTIDYLQRTEFPDNNDYLETRSARSTRLSGLTGTLGAIVSKHNLFGEGDAFHVGATITLPANLSGTFVQTLGVSLDRDTVATSLDGSLTIPLAGRFGVAYTSRERWAFAADVLYEPWSSFSGDFAFGGYDPASGVNSLKDRFRAGGGFQVVPGGRQRSAGYFARTAYRLGGYAERSFYAPFDSNLNTMAITAGISLPMVVPAARFDLGFEAGMRGTTDGMLVRDLFFRGTATINFGERWFVRRRLG